ncbi:DUF4034 domain-containing protein [Streptomyces sp. NBC_00249]|uniref:DUF4034 domain-containing protein n=1 Tax=Streptomyces sp. NBC_00249 TaxID=2975690 RepID=UPI00224CFCCC|nr:DUF4034 domain-containing protein [Streptomyces sp. NBC_00249]MCX5194766.1 DUF4034 domain-containing protein [Streptomyces sp. NBC_00249]
MILNRPARALANRWARTRFDPAAFGLVPRERLDPRAAGPETDPARRAERRRVAEAAHEGEWRTVAAHVRAAGADWDERWTRLEMLIHVAEGDDRWLTDWRTAEPADGDAGTVYAYLLVRRAWAVRGAAYARDVPEQDMRQFQAQLPAAMAAAQRAADLAPGDPGPWVVMITAARAMSYTHSQFSDLWRNLLHRAPHHAAAHWQALQYWCAKWHGTEELMLDFAELTVAGAPPGSILPGVYLHALDELRMPLRGARSAQRRAVLTDVAARLETVPAGHEDLPALRHRLARRLLEAGLHEASLEQFRRIGPYCGAAPWRDDPAGPAVAFDLARGRAAHGARKNR